MISETNQNGMRNTERGSYPKHGSKELLGCVSGATRSAMLSSFIANSKFVRLLVGMPKARIVSVRVWVKAMVPVTLVADGTKLMKHWLFPGGFSGMRADYSEPKSKSDN